MSLFMRGAGVALASLWLACCDGPETSQGNNSQANVSTGSRHTATATASAVTPPELSPVTGDQAKDLMHERHEGMETIGKANKAIRDSFDSGSPNPAVIRPNAAKLADLAQKSSGWFHAGTGPELGKTGARTKSGRIRRISWQSWRNSRKRQWHSGPRPKETTLTQASPNSPTSPRPARAATTSTAATCIQAQC